MALNFARAAAALTGGVLTGAGEGLIAEAKQLHQARRDELQELRATERLKLQDEMAGKRQEASDARQHTNRMAEQEQRQGFESTEATRKREHEKELKTIPQAESASTINLRNAQADYYRNRPTGADRSGEAERLTELINGAEPDDPRIEGWQKRLDFLSTRSGGAKDESGLSAGEKRVYDIVVKRHTTSSPTRGDETNWKAVGDDLAADPRWAHLAALADPTRRPPPQADDGSPDRAAAQGRDAGIMTTMGGGVPAAPAADTPRTEQPPAPVPTNIRPRPPGQFNPMRDTLRGFGGTPADAVPLPPAPRDPAQRKVGERYVSPATGKVVIWRGNGWEEAR